MLYKMFDKIFVVFVSFVQTFICMNAMSTPITSLSAMDPMMTSTLSRRYSLANVDIGNLLKRDSKSGAQPTIVAIPLYIHNNLSKYPSIYEFLTSNSFQQNEPKVSKTVETQSNGLDGTNSLKKLIDYNTKQNDFISTQRYRTQKSMKYNTKEEQQKVVRQRDQNKYESEGVKDSVDASYPYKTQMSSQLISTPNRYLQSNEKSYSRPQQRLPVEEDRKQSPVEYDSVSNTYSGNRFNDLQHNEQKVDDISYSGSIDSIKTNSEPLNRPNIQTYLPFSGSPEGKVIHRSRIFDKSTHYSPQTSSYSSEISEETPNLRYSSDSDNRDDNYSSKTENRYHNNDNNENEMTNKNNEFQYKSVPIQIRSYDRSIPSNYYSTPINTYTSRPSNLRQTYDNNLVTLKPLISSSLSTISSDEDLPQPISSNNFNSNFQPMTQPNVYNSQTNPSNFGADPQLNSYSYNIETQSVSPNNNYQKTESKSNPNYSSDYSTPEDDCYDDNSNDYKNIYSSQSTKPQNIRQEIETKNNERDIYDTEDLDPSKLDLKIIHLPVSLLRRLIGNGDIALPSYQ